jgi:hypothetical protein
VFVEADVGWRNGHAVDCSLNGAQRNPAPQTR